MLHLRLSWLLLSCSSAMAFAPRMLSARKADFGRSDAQTTAPSSHSLMRSSTIRIFSATQLALSSSIFESVTSNPNSIGTITFLIPKEHESASCRFGQLSPVGSPKLLEAVRQLCKKCFYFSDGLVDTSIQSVPGNLQDLDSSIRSSSVVIALGIQDEQEMQAVQNLFEQRRQSPSRESLCNFALDCKQTLPALVGPFDSSNPSLSSRLLPWTSEASAKRLHDQMINLFERFTSDDFAFAAMLFLNAFSGHQVDWVKHSIDATWEKGPVRNAQELYAMVDKCGDCITRCVKDDNCRECIGKLTAIDSRDQVTSYRTIVSYESELLKEFTLCIMTKNNIFQCAATIPIFPKVAPISSWRNSPLTEEAAKSILVGHLDDPSAPDGSLRLSVSWKVACGANVAYDQFPSQNQLFYPAARGRDMWYDPVFRVETLDGRNVWCKRHYKVRPAERPGTFRLSVLDNGVTSNEFWTIIGVADDLSWCAMHYAGAASEVGQRYLGGLLCTPDGQLPDQHVLPEIWEVFRSAGIEPWELYRVTNDDTSEGALEAGAPPLDFYRSEVLARRAAAIAI
ncbi:hypothetical protein MPSEU_000864700 [Mayamaea pseudoterrestris]|nr:hypothetical protein MPSEU_000864700 [Mayamaea pseudoterrestris]